MAKISLTKVSSEELDKLLGVSKDTENPLTTTETTVSKDMRPEEVNHFKAWATAHNMSLTEFFRRAGNAYIVSKDTDKP